MGGASNFVKQITLLYYYLKKPLDVAYPVNFLFQEGFLPPFLGHGDLGQDFSTARRRDHSVLGVHQRRARFGRTLIGRLIRNALTDEPFTVTQYGNYI